MDGILNLYKPVGLTSARTLDWVRRATGQRKSGHAGTLDPAAEGVLLICLGRATKLVEAVMDQPKVYRATARLDLSSPSHDSEKPPDAVVVAHPPGREEVLRACAALEGAIEQVPPAISALKISGRPAYKLARKGHVLELAARRVHVYWLHVHGFGWPELDFELACGRGTYVRALIRDIGQHLGTGGCLTRLVRTAVGMFRAGDAVSIEQLADPERLQQGLMPFEEARARLMERPVAVPERPR